MWSVWFYGISFGFNANGRPILNAEGNKLFNLFRRNMLQDLLKQGCRLWYLCCLLIEFLVFSYVGFELDCLSYFLACSKGISFNVYYIFE